MKRILTLTAALAAVFLLTLSYSCGGGGGSPAPDTTAVSNISPFAPADSAAAAVDRCSYGFVLTGTGMLADEPALVGELSGRLDEGDQTPFLRIVMGYDSTPDDGITLQPSLVLVSGADSAYAYNMTGRILEKGALEEGGNDLLRPAGYAIVNEFFIDGPFSDEMDSDSVVAMGSDTIGGIECNTWMVTYSGGSQAVWSFGTTDHLPRRVERIMTDRQGNRASVILEISDLDVESQQPDSLFSIEVPQDAEVLHYSSFLKVGSDAPTWTLYDPSGEAVSLADLRGNVVVLDFWATWCGPCISVMPDIQSVFETYADEPVRVFGINVWENADPVAFMEENGLSYGLLLEGDQVAEEYMVTGIPTMYVVDPEGLIAFAEVGANPEIGDLLASVVDSLLSEM